MKFDLIARAAQLLRRGGRHRRWRRAVSGLAAVVVFVTSYMLILPALTLEQDTICGLEEHTHTDACYEQRLVCTLEESEPGYEDQQVLTCTLPEGEGHAHTDGCYGLTCALEESAGHTHTEACYTAVSELTCTLAESEGHAHGDSCYGEDGSLICTLEESEGHTHADGCYTTVSQLTCTQEESEGHTHDDGCYGLICGQEEYEAHAHTEACYTTQQVQVSGHVHTEACYEQVLICDLPEHAHTDECWSVEILEPEVPMDGFLCGLEEHIHIDECYDPESGELICTLTEHTHGESCLPEEECEYICGITAHIHTDPCYDPETGELICGLEEHIHDESCLPEGVEYICGLTEHTHDEYVCYDAQGNLTCQRVEHTHTEACLPLEFPMAEQTLTATIYEDGNYAALLEEDDTVITVTGLLPEGVEIRAYPQAVQMDDAVVLCAYDITMFLPDGSVYAPEDDGTFSVSFQMPSYGELVEESAYSYSEYTVYHIPEDGEPEPMDTTVEGDSLIFETDHFSLYVGTVQTTSLLPQAVEAEPEDVTVKPEELGGEAGQVTESGGTNKADGNYAADNVSVSKTIKETGIENVFDITLEVNTQTRIEEIEKVQPLDVVIVLDVSNTMRYRFGKTADNENDAWRTNSRYASAMEAAENFINQFQAESAEIKANRRIGVVAFNTHGRVISELTECKTAAQASDLIRTIKTETAAILGAPGYGGSSERYTNMEAGLYWANHMLREGSNAGENKYVIFLSDGFPTTFGWNTTSGMGGKNPETDPVFYNRVDNLRCSGTSYSDHAAHYAENWASLLKGDGYYTETGQSSAKAKVFVVGVDIGGQKVTNYLEVGNIWKFSVVDRLEPGHDWLRGQQFVIGKTGDSADEFKNWLTTYISSGKDYYFDSNDSEELTDAFATIFQTIKEQTETAVEASWVANDPIKSGASSKDYIEFIGFYNKDEEFVPVKNSASLTGSAGQDEENTASWKESSDAISWDLKTSGYIADTSGNTTTYTYTLKYRVRLENEKGGFEDSETYRTNGDTTMIYRVDTNGVLSNAKRIKFPEPAVKGYLETLEFKKVDGANKELAGATFTLTHDAESCNQCHGDETAVLLKEYQAISDAYGTVTFADIPSGHDYILEETLAPPGYSKIDDTWTVKVHYNNDDQTATDARTDAVLTLLDGEGSVDIDAFQVANVSQPELPSTGGMGVVPYFTLGSLMTIGGGLLLIRRRWKGGHAAR